MKWDYQYDDRKLLAIADAEGCLKLVQLETDPSIHLKEVNNLLIDSNDAINLNLDWNDKVNSSLPKQIVCSLSNGKIATVNFAESDLVVDKIWYGHEFDYVYTPAEVWSVSYNPNNTNIVLSGSDDTYLKMWDLRMELYDFQKNRPVMMNRSHSAGVCTQSWHPCIEHCFCTGSYDGFIRIFDDRNFISPVMEFENGGGIWRLKWRTTMLNTDIDQQTTNNQLLVAGMRAGFNIIDVDLNGYESIVGKSKSENNSRMKRLCQYMKQGGEELAYGVDWLDYDGYVHSTGHYDPNEAMVGSSAFYSHLLHVWKYSKQD